MTTIAGVKLADMKRSKESLAPTNVGKISPDPYSYEHRISLDQDALDKLKVAEVPKVGDKFHFHAHAQVHSVQQHPDGGHSVGLQFTHMAAKPSNGAFDAVSKGVKEAGE